MRARAITSDPREIAWKVAAWIGKRPSTPFFVNCRVNRSDKFSKFWNGKIGTSIFDAIGVISVALDAVDVNWRRIRRARIISLDVENGAKRAKYYFLIFINFGVVKNITS